MLGLARVWNRLCHSVVPSFEKATAVNPQRWLDSQVLLVGCEIHDHVTVERDSTMVTDVLRFVGL